MYAHRVRVLVSADHQITIRLPSEIPPGEAELIVLSGELAEHRSTNESTSNSAADFELWLHQVLRKVPATPVLSDTAFDRANIYDE